MPLVDITNPKVINFLLENYDKETRLRMKWINLHKDKIQECATFKKEVKNYTPADIFEALMVAGMPSTTRDNIVAARYRMTAPVPDLLRVKLGEMKTPEPSMMPVKKEVKNVLEEGRVKYLKVRSKEAPEDKFYFMESSNWKYGWKLGESELKMIGPAHGRVCHLLHNMNSSVGPQPDPEHYSSPDKSIGCCHGI